MTGKRVYRATTSGGPYTLCATITATIAFTFGAVTRGVSYYYRITTVTVNAKASPYSNQAPAKVR